METNANPTYVTQLLSVYTIDLQMGIPQLGLNAVLQGILKISEDDALAGEAVPSISLAAFAVEWRRRPHSCKRLIRSALEPRAASWVSCWSIK